MERRSLKKLLKLENLLRWSLFTFTVINYDQTKKNFYMNYDESLPNFEIKSPQYCQKFDWLWQFQFKNWTAMVESTAPSIFTRKPLISNHKASKRGMISCEKSAIFFTYIMYSTYHLIILRALKPKMFFFIDGRLSQEFVSRCLWFDPCSWFV